MHLVGEVTGLVEGQEGGRRSLSAHDWGANVAWNAALLRPDMFRAVAAMSVPDPPRGATAGAASLEAVVRALKQSPAATGMAEIYEHRLDRLRKYREAYRRYCWPVTTLSDYKLAPFHLLASEGDSPYGQDESVAHGDPSQARSSRSRVHRRYAILRGGCDRRLRRPTRIAMVGGTHGQGGEGMVVKPLDFVMRGPKGLVQPALKCRGREYLRIIYGPEYTADDQLPKLRSRGYHGKRSLAARESRSVLRPWNDSSPASLSAACTNAYSVCSPSKASR